MSKTLSPIFALFVVAATACAAPQISGDQQVKPGGFAELRITGTDDAALWDVRPDPVQVSEIGGTLVFTGIPGTTYNVLGIIARIVEGKIKFERVRFTVVFLSGPGPGPGPSPVPPVPPGPTPPPDPKPPTPAGKLFVVIVEESRQAVGERGAWFADRELAAHMKASGHKLRVVDKDVQDSDGNTPADVKRFVDDAKAKELPQLYLVSEDGKTVRAGPVPKTPAQLVALLKQYGG